MISVIIITKNEEKHIARCINSVCFADEVIVLDSGSTDSTVDIASKLGAKVMIRADWEGYGIQKQRALDACTQQWVLSLDADEFIANAQEAQKIQAAVLNDSIDAYRLEILMMFDKQVLKYAGKDTKHIRLFQREKARFNSNIVHENVCLNPNAKIKSLHASIIHESYSSWEEALHKLNLYSSLSANMHPQKQSSISKAILASIWMFIKNYVIKAWFIDGKTGFTLAVYQAQGSWYRHLKIATRF